jgi:hypothetical protein
MERFSWRQLPQRLRGRFQNLTQKLQRTGGHHCTVCERRISYEQAFFGFDMCRDCAYDDKVLDYAEMRGGSAYTGREALSRSMWARELRGIQVPRPDGEGDVVSGVFKS